MNLIGSLGFNVFQNIGLVGVLCIFLPKWFMGEELLFGDSFTLLAMIYYLFFSVNALTYQSITTLNYAYVVIYRLSEVFRMEEHQKSRVEYSIDGQPAIDINSAEYAWGF